MIIHENPLDGQSHYHIAVSQLGFSEKKTLKCVLGTCVSVVLFPFSRENNYSSMSHFLLASPEKKIPETDEDKYGSILVSKQIQEMLVHFENNDLRAMIFGGSHSSEFFKSSLISDIGFRNIETARSLLLQNKIEIVATNTGGNFSRLVEFNPLRKSSLVRLLKENETVYYSLND